MFTFIFCSIEQVNNLREIQAMRRLSPHSNILELQEVILYVYILYFEFLAPTPGLSDQVNCCHHLVSVVVSDIFKLLHLYLILTNHWSILSQSW